MMVVVGASLLFNESRRFEKLAASGLERPTALIVPESRRTTVGSGYPLLGFRPMDLETAPLHPPRSRKGETRPILPPPLTREASGSPTSDPPARPRGRSHSSLSSSQLPRRF